jgi:hypothetical protein
MISLQRGDAILGIVGGLLAGFLLALWPASADALVLAPAKVEIEASPGNVVRDTIILLNNTDETVTYYSSVEKFEAQGETGTPNFVSADSGLATWTSVPESVTLAPNQSEEVDYTIAIPADAQPGGHFAAIFWSTLSPDAAEGGQVLIGSKSGVLLLVGVAGDFEEDGGVIEFGLLSGDRLVNRLPERLYYRFQNEGGNRLKPEGLITIKNLFGGTATVLNANLTEGNVLPRSIRKFEVLWSTKTKEPNHIHTAEDGQLGFFGVARRQWQDFMFGPYRAVMEVSYGEDGELGVASFRFFVLPWQLLSVIGGLVLVFGFGGGAALKRYNRWVIANASGQASAHKKRKKK